MSSDSPGPMPVLPLDRSVLRAILAQAARVLADRGLRSRGETFGPEREAAILALAIVVLAAPDRDALLPSFLVLMVPLLATSPDDIEVLSDYLSSSKARALLRQLFRFAIAPGPLERSYVLDDEHRQSLSESSEETSRDASDAGSRVSFVRGIVARCLDLLRRIWSGNRRARLVRQSLSAIGPKFRLVLAGASVRGADARSDRRTAVALSAWEERGTYRIDVSRTIDASIRLGGLFQPRWRPVRRAVEYLFLINSFGALDLEQSRLQRLFRRLAGSGVPFACYFYSSDPRHLREFSPAADGSLQNVNLATLVDRHPHGRLVIISAGHELLHPFTLRPMSWTATLLVWPKRAILTPLSHQIGGKIESLLSEQLGFAIGSAGPGGFAGLRSAFSERPSAVARGRARDAELEDFVGATDLRFVTDIAPPDEEQRGLVERLRAYLGDRGFEWLALCCCYPELSLDLTVHLWPLISERIEVTAGDEDELREDLLARLTALCWFRHGFLPVWLRRSVMNGLPRRRRLALRRLFAGMLSAARLASAASSGDVVRRGSADGEDAVALPIWQEDASAADGPEFDAVTIDFLTRGPTRDIDPLLTMPPHRGSVGSDGVDLERQSTRPSPSPTEEGSPVEAAGHDAAEPMPAPVVVEGDGPSEPAEAIGAEASQPGRVAGVAAVAPLSSPVAAETPLMPGRDIQIFISYARIDDEPPPETPDARGFVTFLREQLAFEFRRLGEPRPKIWRDRNRIAQGNQFEGQIEDAIAASEILVVVMSRNWMASDFCQRELKSFVERWKAEGPEALRSRIVVVGKRHVDPEKRPAHLQGQQGFAFYEREGPEDIGLDHEFFTRGNIRDQRYEVRLEQLAAHLWHRAERLGRRTAPPPPPGIAPANERDVRSTGRIVFVAKPADDMREPYARVVKELEGRGYSVVPPFDREIPHDSSALAFIEDALASSEVAVHLLGQKPGFAPDDVKLDRVVKLQLARAGARVPAAETAPEFHRIIWAPKRLQGHGGPSGDLPERDPLAALQNFDRLLPSDKIEGDSLSKFIDFLTQDLRVPRRPSGAPQNAALMQVNVRLYLYHSQEDEGYALILSEALQERHIETVIPAFDGPGAEIQSFHRRNLAECDAVALLWAKASEVWVRARSSELRDWSGLGRKSPFRFRAVIVGPPVGGRKVRLVHKFPSSEIDLILYLSDGEQPTASALDPLIRALGGGLPPVSV